MSVLPLQTEAQIADIYAQVLNEISTEHIQLKNLSKFKKNKANYYCNNIGNSLKEILNKKQKQYKLDDLIITKNDTYQVRIPDRLLVTEVPNMKTMVRYQGEIFQSKPFQINGNYLMMDKIKSLQSWKKFPKKRDPISLILEAFIEPFSEHKITDDKNENESIINTADFKSRVAMYAIFLTFLSFILCIVKFVTYNLFSAFMSYKG